MANEVQICNLALSRLGGYRIQSLTENTKEARECALHYPLMRDAVLEDHDWDFARKRKLLALLPDTYTDWAYAYQYPTDCLIARRLISPVDLISGRSFDMNTSESPDSGKSEYEVITNDALNRRIVLTDKAEAELVYTAKVTDVNMFSSLFVNAFAWRLASDLAIPLKGKPALHKDLYQQYLIEMGRAKTSAANQGYSKPDSSILSAR